MALFQIQHIVKALDEFKKKYNKTGKEPLSSNDVKEIFFIARNFTDLDNLKNLNNENQNKS
jgi:hypothetical protein